MTCLPAVALYGDVPARELPVKEGRALDADRCVGRDRARGVELLARPPRAARRRVHGARAGHVYGPRQRPDGGVVAAFAAALAAGEAPVTDRRRSPDPRLRLHRRCRRRTRACRQSRWRARDQHRHGRPHRGARALVDDRRTRCAAAEAGQGSSSRRTCRGSRCRRRERASISPGRRGPTSQTGCGHSSTRSATDPVMTRRRRQGSAARARQRRPASS